MALTTTTEIAGPVNFIFQETLLRNAKSRAPYFIGHMQGEIMSHGSTFSVKWRRVENLTPTVTALTEDTGNLAFPVRTGTQFSVTDPTATLSKYGAVAFLTDEVDLINSNSHADKYAEVMGIQGGASLNRLQRNILEDNATKLRASGVATDGEVVETISRSLIKSGTNALNRNDALKFTASTMGSTNINTTPVRDAYWGLCHSDVEEDVRELQGFIAVEQYSSQTETARGEFGAVGGVRFISSSDASIDTDSGGAPGADLRSTTGTSADLYTTVVFGIDFHGAVSLDTSLIKEVYLAGDTIPGLQIIAHGKGSSGVADPLNETSSIGWKAWHAGVVLNSAWGRALITGASVLN